MGFPFLYRHWRRYSRDLSSFAFKPFQFPSGLSNLLQSDSFQALELGASLTTYHFVDVLQLPKSLSDLHKPNRSPAFRSDFKSYYQFYQFYHPPTHPLSYTIAIAYLPHSSLSPKVACPALSCLSCHP